MLKRVSIQNFKSLKDVTLDLQKVNLLIGPNNSGKTNFLKALEYFRIYTLGKTNVSNDIIFKRSKTDLLSLQLSFENIQSEKDIYLHYFLSSLADEAGIRRGNYNYQLQFGQSETITSPLKNINFDNPNNAQNFAQQSLDYRIGSGIIYKPDPNKLDRPGPVGRGDDFVAADASNLIAFFDRIRDEYPVDFAQIKADLTRCVPEFTEINFQNIKSTEELIKQFGDKTFKRIGLTDERQKTIYWADELSEGTLYFIAILCIINQPNPPKLLLLEEPEKGIHPRRIHEVIQFILRLVEEKDVQVIMTTHSPIVVDMFKDMPESVFIFDKDEEGATQVKNLQKDIIEPETEKSKQLGIEPPHYTSSLGNAWTVGFLGGVPK